MIDYAHAWKERLEGQLPVDFAESIDIFESQMMLKKQGKMEDRIFAETRLRLGLYGQRYDNGHRFDGVRTRKLEFPHADLTKGPETCWDAPGMVRIKIPFGGATPEQIETIAELGEEYSDNVCHITTRQDIQLHFVHIENTPMLMRRLAAVGITTREACGNSVRNVTACQIAGTCATEAFDVTPYSTAIYKFLLGHPDTMEFGRKFKIAFSGCADKPCALTNMHDFGLIARLRQQGGNEVRGFKFVVGGGLGAVPFEAQTLYEFLPVTELLPVAQCVSRVYARLGEKNNRAMARIKFLVKKLGIDEFRRLVEEERKVVPVDSRWTSLVEGLENHFDQPLKAGAPFSGKTTGAFATWMRTNVETQKQAGYYSVLVTVPLGDLSADQMRGIADLARRTTGGHVRFSIEQNVVIRYVSGADIESLYHDLDKLGLAKSHAGTIADITACPGTDTCKLGTSSSRGLAFELQERLTAKLEGMDPEVEKMKIKISGCFNSCGQHHVAQLGFYGVSRKKDGKAVPYFQIVLGGRWSQKPGSYGLPVAAIPSKNVPAFIDAILDHYVSNRQSGESFSDYIARLGKKEVRVLIEPFAEIPAYDVNPDPYHDWGDARLYSTDDKGIGECAGEVVSLFDFEINESERQAFDGQLALEEGHFTEAVNLATRSMISGARALVRLQYRDLSQDPQVIAQEFKQRFCDTGEFEDKRRSRIADYFFKAVAASSARSSWNGDDARQALQEAYLFSDKVHTCSQKLTQTATK